MQNNGMIWSIQLNFSYSALAALLCSPREDAKPLPGRPWEVVPVQGRAPIAHVDTAASADVKIVQSVLRRCHIMAVLLNKPAATANVTVTWNFAGGLIEVPVGRANAASTFWQASLMRSQLTAMLTKQIRPVMLRIHGRLEGEASLAALRNALEACVRL